MENNFDKFFKDKLEQREFEMKPEYWEGAEALIMADEKDDDRKRFLIWFAMIAILGLAVFSFWKYNSSNELAEQGKITNTTLGNQSDDKQSKTINNHKNSETAVTLNSELENNLNSKNENITEGKPRENKNIFSQSTPSNLNGNKNKKEYLKEVSDNDFPIISPNENNSSLDSGGNLIIKSEEIEKNKSINPIVPNEPTLNTEDKAKVEEVSIQPIAASNSISLIPFLELLLANNQKIEELDLEPVCPFTPPRDKFVLGIFGGAVGYPLVENSSEKPFIGFKTGILAEHNFEIGKAKMALGAELAYHYRSGTFDATKEYEIARYSFGRSVAQARLTPENLHYVELPIYLKYQRKRMTFETGVSFNTLLGVRGKVTEVDGSIQSGWIPSLGFKSKHVNVLLGLHLRISDNLHFGVRANYTPGGILDETAMLPEGITVALQESKPLYLTFRVTQYLKFRR